MSKFLALLSLGFLIFTSNLQSQNSLTPLDSALIACFPFSGNANDMSGNNNNGTVNGAVLTADRFSNPNSAYSFNGSLQNIIVPNFGNQITTNEVSISFWATSTVIATRSAFLFSPDDPTNRFNVHVYYGGGPPGQTIWDFGNISNGRLSINSGTLPAVNTWDHWVFVTSQTGNYEKCYKNGVLQLNKSGSSTFSNANPKDLLIGGGVGVSSSYLWFDGKLDDIRIYKRVLTQTDVTNLYTNNPICPACAAVPTPTNNTDPVLLSFCAGNSTTLTVASSPTVNWYSSASSTLSLGTGTSYATPTYTLAGTYTLYAKAVSECTVSNVVPIEFTVIPKPNLQVSATNSVICFGETTSLTASGATSYTWEPGSVTSSSILVSPTSNTSYTVTGKDPNGCMNTSIFTIYVSTCTGILTVNGSTFNYKIFPNPVNETLSIEMTTSTNVESTIELMDIKGVNLLINHATFTKENSLYKIDMRGLSTGVYYLKISAQNSEPRFVKLIKE